MSAALTRRALLGSTGAVAAVATIATVPAVAGSLPVLPAQAGPVDPHVGLARRLAAAQAEMEAASAACYAIEARLPAWAQAGPDDQGRESGAPEIDPETRERLGWPPTRYLSTRAGPDDVKSFYGLGIILTRGNDPDLCIQHQEKMQRLLEAVELRKQQQAAEQERHGLTAASERHADAVTAFDDVCCDIVETPATTISGVLMKLLVLAGPEWEQQQPDDDDNEEAMLRTIIADVRRLAVRL